MRKLNNTHFSSYNYQHFTVIAENHKTIFTHNRKSQEHTESMHHLATIWFIKLRVHHGWKVQIHTRERIVSMVNRSSFPLPILETRSFTTNNATMLG
jgi:hypothetical protein